ncbi:MAG: TolC family protein [Acidobacteria bacterium]|nr:TolC family protein [Acidobacteriota bacterium]
MIVRSLVWLLIACCAAIAARAQSPESYRGLLTARVRSDKLPASDRLKKYVDNGKLRLSLRDAILLTLEANSNIQIEETQIETSKFNLLSSFQPFDPLLTSNFTVARSSTPTSSQLQGVGQTSSSTLNVLNHNAAINYSQLFSTGTIVSAGILGSRSSTNNGFLFLNPFYSTGLNLQFTQPLLRNFGRSANTAQIRIARRGLAESRSVFAAEVNDAIQQVIIVYWSAVQSRGALDVQQRALKLAETSFNRNKRSLELGALPPLDISRSESEVAARRVELIQAQQFSQQAEEALRLTIGADQDPMLKAISIELTESAQPSGDLENVDSDHVLATALSLRPEVSAAKDALAIDETGIRFARNQLKPDLSLNGQYASNGIGGNQYDLVTGQLTSQGGLGSSFGQLFGFGFPTYQGSLTLNFPLRNRGAQSRLGNALVNRTRDLYNSRQTEEVITRQVRDAVNQLNAAKLSLAAANTSVDLAKKFLLAEQRKVEIGDEDDFFVLDAQTRLAAAETSQLTAQITYQLAVAAIRHATGDLLTPYQMQIEAASK